LNGRVERSLTRAEMLPYDISVLPTGTFPRILRIFPDLLPAFRALNAPASSVIDKYTVVLARLDGLAITNLERSQGLLLFISRSMSFTLKWYIRRLGLAYRRKEKEKEPLSQRRKARGVTPLNKV